MNGQEGPALSFLHSLKVLSNLRKVCILAVKLPFQLDIDLIIHDLHLVFLYHVFRPWRAHTLMLLARCHELFDRCQRQGFTPDSCLAGQVDAIALLLLRRTRISIALTDLWELLIRVLKALEAILFIEVIVFVLWSRGILARDLLLKSIEAKYRLTLPLFI